MVDSKVRFREALLKLCEATKLSKITVKQIVTEAGTARQTFYNCFRDVNELIAYTGTSLFLSPNVPLTNPESMRLGYEIARQHKHFFCQLPHLTGQNAFRESLFDWLYEAYCSAYIPANLDKNERMYYELHIRNSVHGGVDIFLDWCASNMEWPIDIVNKVLVGHWGTLGNPVTAAENPPAPSRKT